MPIYRVYVDDETDERLQRAARELERTVEDLAESAVSEAALDHHLNRTPGGRP